MVSARMHLPVPLIAPHYLLRGLLIVKKNLLPLLIVVLATRVLTNTQNMCLSTQGEKYLPFEAIAGF